MRLRSWGECLSGVAGGPPSWAGRWGLQPEGWRAGRTRSRSFKVTERVVQGRVKCGENGIEEVAQPGTVEGRPRGPWSVHENAGKAPEPPPRSSCGLCLQKWGRGPGGTHPEASGRLALARPRHTRHSVLTSTQGFSGSRGLHAALVLSLSAPTDRGLAGTCVLRVRRFPEAGRGAG